MSSDQSILPYSVGQLYDLVESAELPRLTPSGQPARPRLSKLSICLFSPIVIKGHRKPLGFRIFVSATILTTSILLQIALPTTCLDSFAAVPHDHPNITGEQNYCQIRLICVFVLRFMRKNFQFFRPIAGSTTKFIAPWDLRSITKEDMHMMPM